MQGVVRAILLNGSIVINQYTIKEGRGTGRDVAASAVLQSFNSSQDMHLIHPFGKESTHPRALLWAAGKTDISTRNDNVHRAQLMLKTRLKD